jgi:hypothetical protein
MTWEVNCEGNNGIYLRLYEERADEIGSVRLPRRLVLASCARNASKLPALTRNAQMRFDPSDCLAALVLASCARNASELPT